MTAYDFIIVGAGLSGLTAARLLAEAGNKVAVVERRGETGGNAYDYVDPSTQIRVQKYGPHIFHTSDKGVFDFLSRFTEWEPYEHKVLGNINGKLVPIPFNLTSLFALYDAESAKKLKDILTKEVGYGVKVPILKLRQHSDPLVREFAEFVYQNVFYKYTLKQWGFKPEELGEAVGRVPVYISYEDRYFTDTYQFMPRDGFTKLAENIADHKNITVYMGQDAMRFTKISDGKIYLDGREFTGGYIYTGRVEELFENKFGPLDYRSLVFKTETLDMPSFQPVAVVNYNTSMEYTRITEFGKLGHENGSKTIIAKEYSKPFEEGDIPYYPIPKPECRAKYELYRAEADKIGNLHLLGRLACYKYINMDAAVRGAIDLCENILRR